MPHKPPSKAAVLTHQQRERALVLEHARLLHLWSHLCKRGAGVPAGGRGSQSDQQGGWEQVLALQLQAMHHAMLLVSRTQGQQVCPTQPKVLRQGDLPAQLASERAAAVQPAAHQSCPSAPCTLAQAHTCKAGASGHVIRDSKQHASAAVRHVLQASKPSIRSKKSRHTNSPCQQHRQSRTSEPAGSRRGIPAGGWRSTHGPRCGPQCCPGPWTKRCRSWGQGRGVRVG